MVRRILLQLCFACLVLGFTGACGTTGPEPTATPTKTPAPAISQPEPPTPTPVEVAASTSISLVPTATPTAEQPGDIAPYTGLRAAHPENLKHRPLFICVNNDAAGRAAHHGLSLADIVYEYIVDGFTLTRITAMYHSNEAERIGPVRSARLPNVWMTYMYDGALACSGGSDEVRYLLKNEVGFPYLDADIDDPSNNRYFFTVGTDYRTRMQARTEGVRRWLEDNNLTKEWNRPGFLFSAEPPANAAGTADGLTIAYPGGNGVEWRYDENSNGYLRFQGGQPQVDPATGQPIVAQNVIIMVAEHTLTDIVEDSLGTKGVDIELYGFGAFRIFRDGQVYEGTWRADPENPPRWLGPGEAIIALKPGQSWIQVVRALDEVTY